MGEKRHLGLIGAVLLAVLSLSGVRAQTGASPEDSALQRLPRFCAYKVDLRGLANPHKTLAETLTDRDIIVCPFATGAQDVMVYAPRFPDGCKVDDFPGASVSAVSELDVVTATRAEQCRANRDSWPPVRATGPAYEVSFIAARNGPALLPEGVDIDSRVFASGAPIDFASSGFGFSLSPDGHMTIDPRASVCMQMKPDAGIDAMAYLRLIGIELPANATQRRVPSCDGSRELDAAGKPISEMHSDEMTEEATFTLWLRPSRDTPAQARFDRQVAATLRSAGAKVTGGRYVRNGYETLVSVKDGVKLGLIGGPRQVMVDMRALSPGVCSLLYDLAVRERLAIDTSIDTGPVLTPPGVKAEEREASWRVTPTTSATDLCLLLQPGFDYWRKRAPKLPLDLRDLDNRQMGLGN